MSSIKESGIFNWAATSEKGEFSLIDPSAQSYFEDSSIEETGIEEYDFKNIPELMDMIGKHTTIRSKEFVQLCAIEIFQNRPHMSENCMTEEDHVDIPDFVYVF